jgi:hypothetical protein
MKKPLDYLGDKCGPGAAEPAGAAGLHTAGVAHQQQVLYINLLFHYLHLGYQRGSVYILALHFRKRYSS